jgi:hypothetical protein
VDRLAQELIRKFELTAISTLEPIQDRHFKNETVDIDGRRFLSCSFENCLLNYSGGDVEFGPGCSAVDCRPIFSGPAGKTLRLLQVFGLLSFSPDDESKDRTKNGPFTKD